MSCDPGPKGAPGPTGIPEAEVLMEFRDRKDGVDVIEKFRAKLFVDRERNRLGVMPIDGHRSELYMPLSDMLSFLKREVL